MAKNKKYLKNRSQKVGLPAGTIHKGDEKEKAGIWVFNYNQEVLEEKKVSDLHQVKIPHGQNTWVNFDGIKDPETLELAQEKFKLHPLMIEDISSPDQRPKLDEFDRHLYLTLRTLDYQEKEKAFDSDQISFVLSENYLLTFQEKPGDCFDPNRERIRGGKGRTRKMGPDYLMYALIDTVVDNYYVALEKIGNNIEALELELIRCPDKKHLDEMYNLRNETLYLKKLIWPLRDVINKLIRDENTLIKPETRLFLKDVYDHCLHVIETVESYRDLLAAMMDLYLNSVSHRLNEVMKVLTVISTIFIPLTFITSIYGMNFEFLPELKFKLAYPILLAVMAVIIVFQLYFFRRKGWL
jgi:magnesium transporter